MQPEIAWRSNERFYIREQVKTPLKYPSMISRPSYNRIVALNCPQHYFRINWKPNYMLRQTTPLESNDHDGRPRLKRKYRQKPCPDRDHRTILSTSPKYWIVFWTELNCDLTCPGCEYLNQFWDAGILPPRRTCFCYQVSVEEFGFFCNGLHLEVCLWREF